ncbi:prickle-like protein 4 [Pelodytes ibericus]
MFQREPTYSGNRRSRIHLIRPLDSAAERFCTALGAREKRELQRFSAHRRLHSLRQGAIVAITSETPERCCVKCSGKILVGDTAVYAGKMQDKGHCWHVGGFVCDTCHMPLLQFIYFLQDGRIYCGRHHAELTRARCAACDQLILSERCIVAEGHHWHVEHFLCWECDVVLGGNRYVMKGGRPFCSSCFLHLYAESCEACGNPVDPDGDPVTFRGQYWHSLPSCFCCSSCRAPLQVSEFNVHDGSLYCSENCFPCSLQIRHSSNSLTGAVGNRLPIPKYMLYFGIGNLFPTAPCHSVTHVHCSHQDHVVASEKRASNGLNLSLQDNSSVTGCQEESSQLWRDSESDTSIPRIKGHNDLDEDTSCSSSDSEPEGFFLRSRIPKYCTSRSTPSPLHGKKQFLKRRQRGKNCKVS